MLPTRGKCEMNECFLLVVGILRENLLQTNSLFNIHRNHRYQIEVDRPISHGGTVLFHLTRIYII